MTSDAPEMARTMAIGALMATLLASLAIVACGSEESSTSAAPDYEAAIAQAPPELAALYANGDELIEGGEEAYDSTLAAVEGYPAVVNNWASWCGPCREEFPHFQSQAAEHLDEVAFLGVDSEDSPEAYETFLRDSPIPYPSVADDDGKLPNWVSLSLVGIPNTLFYDSSGELVYTHQGPYEDEASLAADIEKYALSS